VTGRDWLAMDPDDFGKDGPGVLFDASHLARKPQRCGEFETPDLFTLDEEGNPDGEAS
jgi:hypothetical protein